ADHAQDLAGRRLLLEGLGQVAIARLQLLEQPDVLDGDDRLVGERAEKLDLRVAERADAGPAERDRTDGPAVAEHRDPQETAEARGEGGILHRNLRVGEDVRDVDDGLITDDPRRAAGAARPHRKRPAERL